MPKHVPWSKIPGIKSMNRVRCGVSKFRYNQIRRDIKREVRLRNITREAFTVEFKLSRLNCHLWRSKEKLND